MNHRQQTTQDIPAATAASDHGAPEPMAPDLGACVAGLVNVVAKGMAELVAPHNLQPLEFALLRLFLQKERWTTTELAQVLPVTTSRISRVVTKLAEMGLVRRRRQRNDRRLVWLSLTDEGKTLTQSLNQKVRAYDARLARGLTTEEMATFTALASRIVANYDAMEAPDEE